MTTQPAPESGQPTSTGGPPGARASQFSGTQAIGVALILAALFVVAAAIWTDERRNAGLTGLEQLLFGLIVTILTTVGSIVVAEHYYRLQGAREYQQLAQPALRRVLALHESVEAISDHIQERLSQLEATSNASDAVVKEWLEGSVAMLALHAGQLRASVIDWRQLLPADYQELQDTLRLQTEYRTVKTHVQALEREIARKLEDRDQAAESERKRELEALRSKLGKVEEKLAERPSGILSTFPSGTIVSGRILASEGPRLKITDTSTG